MLGQYPISSLKVALDTKFPAPEGWTGLETETILLEVNSLHDELLADKVNVLKVILLSGGGVFCSDMMFFAHATEVINNQVADFETVPLPTSLEIAYALYEFAAVLGVDINHVPQFSDQVREFVRYTLIEEGYSGIVHPFDVLGIHNFPNNTGNKDVRAQDLADKEKAIAQYVKAVRSQRSN